MGKRIAKTFYLDQTTADKIRELSFIRRVSESEIVRQLIDDYIKSLNK